MRPTNAQPELATASSRDRNLARLLDAQVDLLFGFPAAPVIDHEFRAMSGSSFYGDLARNPEEAARTLRMIFRTESAVSLILSKLCEALTLQGSAEAMELLRIVVEAWSKAFWR
jgi:hypothetical protein